MGTEIERKFLLPVLPDLSGLEYEKIRQGYLCFETDREVRIREKGSEYFICYKRGSGLERVEIEFTISENAFNQLWLETDGRQLEKTRYYMESSGFTYEIDIYSGFLTGLNVIEVEFSSVLESKNFQVPDYFGRELTDDQRYRNRTLIFKGLP